MRMTLPANARGTIRSDLTAFRKDFPSYLKELYSKKREGASHVLIIMISDEERSLKPYAIPVRATPFKGITDARVRELRDEVRNVIISLNMTVVGFVTDGEWHSIRTQGSERAVSIIQLLMDARKEAGSIRVNQIKKYLKINPLTNQPHHHAVPIEDVIWLHDFMNNGRPGEVIGFDRSIHILKRKQFPFFYDPYPWINGTADNTTGCLKSLMAQYIFRNKVNQWKNVGVDFVHYPCFPEFDERIGEFFHEREDHGHLLKRFTNSFREGDMDDIDLRFFVDALNYPRTGSTKQALTGERKQSIPDCERVFSLGVLNYK